MVVIELGIVLIGGAAGAYYAKKRINGDQVAPEALQDDEGESEADVVGKKRRFKMPSWGSKKTSQAGGTSLSTSSTSTTGGGGGGKKWSMPKLPTKGEMQMKMVQNGGLGAVKKMFG